MSEEHQTTETAAEGPDWGQFMAGIDQLNETVANLHNVVQQGQQPKLTEPPKAPPAPELPENLEEMSRADLVRWMRANFVNGVVDKVTEIVKPALDQQQQNQVDVATERYTREIGEIIERKGQDGQLLYPDFRDWQDEMIEVVKEMPGVTPLRAYTLARSENPEKRAELDRRYAPKAPEPPKKPFSLSPYGSGADGAAGGVAKHKTSEDAFRAALAKTSAKFPGVLPSLD